MENIIISATDRSPAISFDFAKNEFSLSGESYPEDVNEFYGPIMVHLEKHLATQTDAAIKFIFELIYFNSSTAKILIGLFELMDNTAQRNNNVIVEWCFDEEDDNMEELGEEFGEDLKTAQFVLKAIPAE